IPTQNAIAALTISAVVGGAASVAGGGKFANGAVTAAFAYLATPNWEDMKERPRDPEAFENLYNAGEPPLPKLPGALGALSILAKVLAVFDVGLPLSDSGQLIYRGGGTNPANLTDPDGLSFRDSLSNPVDTPLLRAGKDFFVVDTTKLPT